MEAITATKIPERAGTLEESGPEAVDGLFSQVLAGQQTMTGQGGKPEAGNPEAEGLKPEQPGTGGALPTASTDGTPSETLPLLAVATVLHSGSVPEGLVNTQPFPDGLEAEPVLTALPEEGKGPGSFLLAAFFPNTAGPTDKALIPNAEPGGALSKTGLVRTVRDSESFSSVRAGAGPNGGSLAALAGDVTGRPPGSPLSPSALPEDYPSGTAGVSGSPVVVQETARPIRAKALTSAAMSLQPDVIPDETRPQGKSRPIHADAEPAMTTVIQAASVTDSDPAASAPLPAVIRIKLAAGQIPLAEHFQTAEGSAPDPAGERFSGRETKPGFFKKEIEMASGEKDQGAPSAPSRPVAQDLSGTIKPAPAQAPEAPQEGRPRDPEIGRESIPVLTTGSGPLGNEEDVPGAAEGKFAITPEGSPGPKASMPPGMEMTAGHPLERQPPEAASRINGPPSSAAFTDRAEEPQPLFGQVSRGMVWSLRRGEEKIQLSLDPPHLGTIFLELHRNRQTVEAQVWTDNPAAKGLLDTQQGQLHKALEQEGFRLGRFEVAVQPDLKSFSEERFARGRHPAWEGPRDQGHSGGPETAWSGEPERPISLFQNGNRYIDTWI